MDRNRKTQAVPRSSVLKELKETLHAAIVRWYPLVVDREAGGYFTNVRADWTLPAEQEKMIVTQARHVWTTSKLARFTGDQSTYEWIARHGFAFLRDVMWDERYGGFYQIRNRHGGPSDVSGWRDEKRTYGNAFAVYALAALYGLSGDPDVLALARRAFDWIEEHAHDPVRKGYFQFLTREGNPFDSSGEYQTVASDRNELGFKDQNSSIHLMEAYTELYRVWRDERLRARLLEILTLIRDTMVSPKGYLRLFFHADWTPISFRDATPEARKENYGLDHVSFGHDYETAFLMLEASGVLGLENDVKTLSTGKRMLDHALESGWDEGVGGFYDGGYYCEGDGGCSIIKDTKNWWAQAEGLNALLLFSKIFEDQRYLDFFRRQWRYVNTCVIDHERGDWYEGGIDKEPGFKDGLKSHIWKGTYHTCRALMNCIAILSERSGLDPGIAEHKREIGQLIEHWKAIRGPR